MTNGTKGTSGKYGNHSKHGTKNGRTDAIYFILLAAVAMIGYSAANREEEPVAALPIPDFSLPPITLDIAIDLPISFVKFESTMPTSMDFSSDMESTLIDNRLALLESSMIVEIRPTLPQ